MQRHLTTSLQRKLETQWHSISRYCISVHFSTAIPMAFADLKIRDITKKSCCTRSFSFKAILDDMGDEREFITSAYSSKDSTKQTVMPSKDRNDSGMCKKKDRSAHRTHSVFSNFFFRDLEKRTMQHINSFPSSYNDSRALTKWQKITVQLIMDWTKLWGKKRVGSPQQIGRGVSLADELVEKLLAVTKQQVAKELKHYQEMGQEQVPLPSQSASPQRSARQTKDLDTEICCQMVALGWSRCDHKATESRNAGKRAQKILNELEEIYHMYIDLPVTRAKKLGFTRQEITPTARLYNHVLSCWSRTSDPDAEYRAKDLLNHMTRSDRATSLPDVISYNNMLHLHANKGDVEKAEAILSQMEHSTTGNLKPDVFSYAIIMNALRKRFLSNHDMKDPSHAEKILTEMVQKGITPNSVCFGTVLSMYAAADRFLHQNSNHSRRWKTRGGISNNIGWGADNAKRVLYWMIDLYERSKVQINSQHFVTVIDAIAKSGKGVEGAKQCEELCDRLISFYEKSGSDDLRPRPQCFGAVIDAWSKSDEKYSSAEHAEKVLNKMETYFIKEQKNKHFMLSNIAYNLVIDAWSRRSGNDTVKRAESIIDRMVKNYELTKNESLRPDVISFTSLMKAFVTHRDGGNKALKLLEEMNMHVKAGNIKAKPDSTTIAIAMDACVKNGLLNDASRIMNDVDDKSKTRVMFNTLLSTYKFQGRGAEAEEMLRNMIDLSERGFRMCAPDSTTYACCIYAWGATAGPTSQQRLDRAMALFNENLQGFVDGDELLKPRSTHFNNIAEMISSSDDPNKDTLVLEIIEKMENFGCVPSLVTFNILIKTCASINGTAERKSKALKVAATAFNTLGSVDLKPDSITYVSMFHALLNLSSEYSDRVGALSNLFKRCCADGCLNQHMLNTLADKTSVNEFSLIFGELGRDEQTTIQIDCLPSEWSRRSSVVPVQEA